MNLIIDFGNSFAKFYLFQNSEVKSRYSIDYLDLFLQNKIKIKDFEQTKFDFLESFFTEKKIIFENVIISSVINYPSDFISFFQNKNKSAKIIELSEDTPVPIKNLYNSKSTLGKDRLAAAVGANYLCKNTALLVIDAGSAITYEFISAKNEYLGGNISPGLQMRLNALHHFTKKLPFIDIDSFKVSVQNLESEIGNNTKQAIVNGVFKGLIAEIEAYIEQIKVEEKHFKVFLTGGDLFFFEKNLKNSIFAEPNLVAIGLNTILNYNI